MSSRTEKFSAVASKTLRQDGARQTLREQAKKLTDEVNLGRKGSQGPPTANKRAVPSTGGGAPGSAGAGKKEDVYDTFDSSVETNSARARRGKATLDSPAPRRATPQVRAAIKNEFGLEPEQARTLEYLLGKRFADEINVTGVGDIRKAQEAANRLRAAIKEHWDAALPPGQTRDDSLRSVYADLQAARRKNPKLNASRFVRNKLFANWRIRFMRRLGADRAFAAELELLTGVKLVMDGDVPKFLLELEIGGTTRRLGLDIDHDEMRLADAVAAARGPGDLRPIVDSESLQLLTPRENRTQIEALRKATRKYFEGGNEATLDYFKRKGVTADELNRIVDEMLDGLDRAGDYI